MEGITLTLFGLIIGYILPGMVAIYSLTFWSPSLVKTLSVFLTANSNPWLFLFFLFLSLIFGLMLNSFRGLLFGTIRKKSPLYDFKGLTGETQLNAFMTLLAENYRFHQFAGCMVIILPVAYFGWLIKYANCISWGEILFSSFILLAIEGTSFLSAVEAEKKYLERLKSILNGGENV